MCEVAETIHTADESLRGNRTDLYLEAISKLLFNLVEQGGEHETKRSARNNTARQRT